MTLPMEEHLDLPLSRVLSIMQKRILSRSTYFGIKALMSPLDFWVYQEIIYASRPDVIVEIGIFEGGGTLSLAHICDLLGSGRVIGLDLSHQAVPEKVRNHPRVTLIEGDACRSFEEVQKLIGREERVMVIEDSSHTYENTLQVLRTYSRLIQPGDYFIVEDGICQHGLPEGASPGPYEAVEQFVKENEDFEIDRDQESFMITWNPKGYLRRTGRRQKEGTVPPVEERAAPPGRMKGLTRETMKLFIPPIVLLWIRKFKG